MIRSNIRKAYEITAKQGKTIEVYTVGASNQEEARGLAMGLYKLKSRDILEVN